jgi:hypothetical protein
MPNMDNFNDLVLEEMEVSAVKTLKTHPRDLVDRALYAINRVYVSTDPEEDTKEDKLNAAADLLENIAGALRDPSNPLEVEYLKDGEGNYTGEISFRVGTEAAKTMLLTQVLLERSYKNRVRKAAKKFVQ